MLPEMVHNKFLFTEIAGNWLAIANLFMGFDSFGFIFVGVTEFARHLGMSVLFVLLSL